MTPNVISIVVWHYAKTDPPTDLPDTKRILVEREDGNIGIGTVTQLARPGFTPIVRWAELPVVSDLTDEDVQGVLSQAELSLIDEEEPGLGRIWGKIARLRAALDSAWLRDREATK